MKAKLVIILLILTFALDITSSVCVEGCLSCGKDKSGNAVCKVCDIHNFYRLANSGRCFKWEVENCEIPSADPGSIACNLCKPGYFLDNPGNRCSPVPEKFTIPDCKRYRWEYSCVECDDGFYLRRNRCLPIQDTIDNCSLYLDAKTCAVCKDGYFYHVGTKQCETLTKRDQCLVYSSVQCTECVSNHFEVDNLASGVDLSNDFLQSLAVYGVNESTDSAFYERKPVNQCVLGEVENCARHLSFNECQECMPGFFISPDKQCQSDPIRTVAHCEAYSTANLCSRCVPGFYLEENVCKKLEDISGCLEFNSETEDCDKCDYKKYYLDEGRCGERVKSFNIEFCHELSETDDHCVKCIPSFQLTDDKLKCLPHIPHCQDYVKSTDNTHADYTNVSTVSLRCQTCNTNFYISVNQTECIPQDSPGCVTFDSNTNDCNTCAYGYWKDGTECKLYTKEFCKEFDESSDACTSCFDGFYFSSPDCLIFTARNCLTKLTDSNNCDTCPHQYYLKADANSVKNCEPLTARNCKSFATVAGGTDIENSCADCYQGYFLDNGSCSPLSLLNCAVQTADQNACTTCKDGYYKKGNFCEAYTVKNCASYSPTSDSCVSCIGHIADENPGNRFYLKVVDDLGDADASNDLKDCVAYTVQNCTTKYDDKDECKTCASASKWYINGQGDCVPSHFNHCTTITVTNKKEECGTCANGFKLDAGRCYKIDLPGCKTYDVDNCSACLSGFYLKDQKCTPYTATHCKTYQTALDECATCEDGYTLDSTVCVPTHINFCAIHNAANDSCIECDNGYYLNAPTCAPQDVTNCARFKKNTNLCTECRVGFRVETTTVTTTTVGANAPTSTTTTTFRFTDDPPSSTTSTTTAGVSPVTTTVATTSTTTCAQMTKVPGCLELHPTIIGKCVTCFRGYKLVVTNSTCVLAPAITDCVKYESNTGRCEACKPGKIPENHGSACNAIANKTVNKCVKFDQNNGECSSCDNGYYLDSRLICMAQNVSNCEIYQKNENECLKCKKGYYKSDNKCEAYPNITHCKQYENDRKSCKICSTGYYPSEDGSLCLKFLIKYCRLQIPNTNKCYQCVTGYAFADGTCEGEYNSPTDANCSDYNKEENRCAGCRRDYKLDSGGKCVSFTNSDYQSDTICTVAEADSPKCAQCPWGNKSFEYKTAILDSSQYTGCFQVDTSSPRNCTQCLPDYDTPNSAAKTCTKNTTGICKQLKNNATNGTLLTDGTDCYECRDRTKYVSVSNTCTETKEQNVKKFNRTNVALFECMDGTALITIPASTTKNLTECGQISTTTGIDNCQIYDFDNGNCKKCKYGFNNNSSSCTKGAEAPPVNMYLNYSSLFSVGEWNDTSSNTTADLLINVTNSATVTFTDGLCKPNHLRVVAKEDAGQTNYPPKDHTFTTVDDYKTKQIFSMSYPKFTCVQDDYKYLYTHASNAPDIIYNKSDCSYWVQDGGYLSCRGCLNSKYPIFSKVIARKDGTNAVDSSYTPDSSNLKSTVSACIPFSELSNHISSNSVFNTANLTNDYIGLNYNNHSLTPLSTWLNFTSCSGATDNLIVFAKRSGDHFEPNDMTFALTNPATGSDGKVPNITCYDSSTTAIDGQTLFSNGGHAKNAIVNSVANCQIYHYEDDAVSDVDGSISTSDDGNKIKCLACKPGFTFSNHTGNNYKTKYITDNPKYPTSCTAITNCAASPSTWMNACQTCNTGKYWLVSSDYIVMYHVCVTATLTNCKMAIEATAGTFTCLVCEDTYTLIGTTCILLSTMEQCSTPGLPKLTLGKNATSPENALLFTYIMQSIYSAMTTMKSVYCDKCSGSNFLFERTITTTTATKDVCTNDLTSWNAVTPYAKQPNCLVYDLSATNKCKRCQDDNDTTRYAVDDADKSCADKSSLTTYAKRLGCKRLNSADSNKCTKCHVGYTSATIGGDKYCYDELDLASSFNCESLNATTTFCAICKEGFIHDTTDILKCKPKDSDCKRGGYYGMCLECDKEEYLPINYTEDASATPPVFNYKCVKQTFTIDKKKIGTQNYYDFNTNSVGNITLVYDDGNGFFVQTPTFADYQSIFTSTVKDVCVNVITDPNCRKASKNGFLCSECKEGYYLQEKTNDLSICLPVDTCLKFYPGTNDCEICRKEYKLNPDTKLCEDRAYTPSQFIPDPACKGNNSDGTGCDYCQDGNKALELSHIEVTGQNLVCLTSNKDTGFCTRCDKGGSFTASSASCNAVANTSCLMLMDGLSTTTALADDDCYACDAGYEKTSGNKCIITDFNMIDGTATEGTNPNPDTFAATECTSGSKLISTDNTRMVYECALSKITAVSGCSAHKNNSQCEICDRGKEAVACSDIASYVDIFPTLDLDFNLTNSDPSISSSLYTTGQQIKNNTFKPVQCTTANKLRLSTLNLSSIKPDFAERSSYKLRIIDTTDTSDLTDLEFFPSLPTITCSGYVAASHHFYGANGTTPPVVVNRIINNDDSSLTDCALWVTVSTNKFNCMRCYDGYSPTLATVTHSLTGDTLAYTVEAGSSMFDKNVIETCVKATDATRSYEGLGYHNIKAYPLASVISLDRCYDPGHALIYFLEVDANNFLFIKHVNLAHYGITTSTNYKCCPMNTECFASAPNSDPYNIPSSGLTVTSVQNCQIYIHLIPAAQTGPLAKIGNSDTLHCAACRPGYHPFAAISNNTDEAGTKELVRTCTIIPNCDQNHAKNTWMNSCGKCSSGHTWNWDATAKVVQTHNCVSFSGSNCLVSNGTTCFMCEKDYSINSAGSCLPKSMLNKKNCADDATTYAYQPNKLSFKTGDDVSIISLFFVQYQIGQMGNDYSTVKPYCNACDSGYVLVVKATGDIPNYCSNSLYDTTWTASAIPATNCDVWDPNNITKCAECSANFISVSGALTSDTGTCTSTATMTDQHFLTGCYNIADTTHYKCTKCKDGYQSKGYGTGPTAYVLCYEILQTELYCDIYNFSTDVCTLCKAGYEQHSVETARCIAGTYTLPSDCNQVGASGLCYSCHGEGYYPYTWELPTGHSSGNRYKSVCVDQQRNLGQGYFMLPRGYSFRTHTTFELTDIIPYGRHIRSFTDWATYNALTGKAEASGLANVKELCVRNNSDLSVDNCAERHFEGFQCSRCQGGYSLKYNQDGFNECLSDCLAVDSNQKCVKCNNGNHLNADRTTCTSAYSSLDNCAYKSPFANQCIYCDNGYYLNSSMQCSSYTLVPNCEKYDFIKDMCILCEDGYFLNSSNKCDKYVVDNCQFASPATWGVCLLCNDGFDLINGKCVIPSSASNYCKTRNEDGDCESCYEGYSLSHGNCTQTYKVYDIPGCINYDHHGYLCTECDTELILSNGYCTSRHSENCKVQSETSNACVECEDEFYLAGFSCAPRRKLNCWQYSLNSDHCLSCSEGSYLQKGDCVEYTALYCDKFHPTKDKCITCAKDYFYDFELGKCVLTELENCQVRNPFKNECYVCLPQYYLSETFQCMSRTIDNCAKFDPLADSCIDCIESHYLVTDVENFILTTATGDFNACKPYTVNNCDVYHPRENKCLVCKEDYFLDATHGCLLKSAFDCVTFDDAKNECKSCPENTYLEFKKCNPYSVTNCSVYDKSANACLTCPLGFYLQESNCLPYTVSDCDQFAADENRCSKCKSGFFLRNGLCQVISQNNCATHSQTKDECTSCEDGYYLQNGNCLTFTISCDGYSKTSNKCISCPSGQYLEPKNFTCINYTVNNCKTYSATSNNCETCVPKHYYNNGLCIPYTVTNCKVYHALFDECVTCQENFYHHQKWCLPYNVINCKKLSPVTDVCLVCEENFFNYNGNCFPYTAENCKDFDPTRDSCISCLSDKFYKLRVKEDLFQCKAVSEVDDCDTYEDFEDKCEKCEKGYYLDQSMNTCHEVPETISNCKEFTNAEICKTCVAPYYLDNNTCVKSDHLIDKCIKYQSNTKCLECEGSNMLSEDSTLCLKITESSCETYLNPSQCKTCAGNMVINYIDDVGSTLVSGLNGEDLTNRRAICVDSGISHCTIARNGYPDNICLVCASGYFLSNNTSCLEVTQTIDNCETYYSNGVCSQCTSNHVLSTDKTECLFDVSFLGNNCQAGKFFSEPKCFLCKSGYYFDSNGDCQPCAMDGCAVCTQDSSASCRLCKNGYYMNSEMKCIANGTTTSARLAKNLADDGLFGYDYQESIGRIYQFLFVVLFMSYIKFE